MKKPKTHYPVDIYDWAVAELLPKIKSLEKRVIALEKKEEAKDDKRA